MRQLVETNLLAPMLLTQALLPHLLAQPRAQLVCIGSALGRIGLPGFAAYSATKFGLRGFAEALRRELAGSPVLVQYLGPRSTHTGFNDAGVQAYNRATGTAMDPPQRVAAALLRLIEGEQPERFVGFPESLAVRLNGLAGPWLDGAFDKHRRSLPPLETLMDRFTFTAMAAMALCTLLAPAAALRAAPLDDGLSAIQHDWETIRYQAPAAEREKRFEALAAKAHQLSEGQPGRSEPLIWEGIVLSSWAGEKGGLGALNLAKQAKALLLDEPTSGLDPQAASEFSGLLRRAADSGVAVLTT
eukprot:gene50448-67562_t